MKRSFVLYRFYDAEDRLLYVGLTTNPGRRVEKHRSEKSWWEEVNRIEIEHFDDLSTLRMAERTAIESERPLHNIRMNVQDRNTLVWECEVCGEPIEDGAGYLTVSYADMAAYDKAHQEFRDRHRTPGGWVVYSGTDLADFPNEVSWRVLHAACDPKPDSYDYWIGVERVRSQSDVLSWTAHLLGKNWLPITGWDAIVRKAALV